MKKKTLGTIILSIMLTASLTACDSTKNTSSGNGTGVESGGKNGAIELTYWTPFTGSDGSYMQQIVDDFNESQSKYKVSHEVYTSDTYYDKIKSAVAEGVGPDFAAIHAEQIPTLKNAEAIQELSSEKMEQLGLKEADFVTNALNAGTYEDIRYALPLDAHPLVLYYNKDLVDGINVKIPTTYDELVEEGKKVTKDGVYGFAFSGTWPTHMIFRSAMLQNGQEIVDETGTKSNVNNETGILVYQKLRDLIDVHKIAPEVVEQDAPVNMFKAGEVAFAIDGVWFIAGLRDTGINFGVAPITTLFGDAPAVWAGSHQITYMSQKNIDEAKQKGIDEFVKFLYGNIIHWAEGGQIVAYKPVLNSGEFAALDYLPDLADSIEDVALSQNTLTWPDLHNVIEPNLAGALLGQTTIEEALEKIESDGNGRAQETLSKQQQK